VAAVESAIVSMPEEHFQFGDFVLDRAAYELRRGDEIIALQRIPLELLCLLVDRRGQIVSREEILERVWGKGVFVDIESSINTAIRKLRRALGDDSESPRFVVTVPGRGYRFIAEIRLANPARAEQFRPRSPSVMVGRERELTSLLSGLDDAAGGRGLLFLISGEPGVGKTRLADEAIAVADGRRMAVLVGHCLEHDEAVAYLPFVEMLENFVDRASDQDSLREALGDQAPELARLLPKLKSLLPGLASPLELQPAQARRHLFNCFFDFVARIAAQQMVLIVLEDLHWADDSTLSLLEHLAQRVSGLPLMLIGTYRDAEANLTRGLAKTLDGLLRGRLATRLSLKSLPRDQVGMMLNGLSGKSTPAAVVSEVYDETGGNPFFVEELFRYLAEENRLYDSAGQFRTELKVAEADAPPSVRLVVTRRLTRLGEATQKILATAAVIGRFFSLDLLQAASEESAEAVLQAIEEAEKAGLVISVAETPRVRIAFVHELIRQAVIGGISASRRQRLHFEIAEAIERKYVAGMEATRDHQVAQLAHHYARGGDPGKALKYYLRAVHKFAVLGSCTEAISQFESALEILPELANDQQRVELELDLRIAASFPLGDSTGIASLESERAAERAMALSRTPGINWERRFWPLYSLFWVRHLRPENGKACDLARELVEQAEQHGEAVHKAEAELSLAWAMMYAGEFAGADQGFDRAWALLESTNQVPDLNPQRQRRLSQLLRQLGTAQNNRMVSGWNLWFLGYPERALERLTIATNIADSGTRPMLADIHGFASYVHELRGELPQMRARTETRLAIATEAGYATGRALSEIYLGWADTMTGDIEGGIARMRDYHAVLKATGSEYISDRCLAFIARAHGRMKRFGDAQRAIDEAMAFMARSGQKFYAAELHRVRGELLLDQAAANGALAEQSFRAAIEISREQRAKSWELRATTSLARLLAKQRKRAEARRMLAEIFGWFSEGFDTADLRQAKELLDQLKA
jgi:DNA-binding winged helix-turn-helix (wHTH) protein